MSKLYGTANILDCANTKIKYLYHISDIHIRLHNYHKEYRHVFSNLYQVLSSKPKGLIIITGDILHSKNELSPECILLTIEFLENLSLIMPTILIAGNHDAVLTNNNRVDSLTGILDHREIEDLYYLKYSGIYKFYNIYFGVSSLLDNGFVDSRNIQCLNDEYKIALYHGSVGTPINDFGFKITGDVNIKVFNGYDYVLLGDIHKYQYLNPQKTIAYASSLISQNFGEADLHHGILEWNLIDKTTNYIIIDNPYRYIRYDFDNDSLPILTSHAKLQVKISKIKELNDLEYLNRLNSFKKYLAENYPNVNTNYIYTDKINKSNVNNNTISINDKLNEYIISKYPHISNCDKQWIIDNIDWKDNTKTVNNFTPLYMTWSYMCKYGKDNVFNFTKLTENGINGIIQRNSAGKSSFIDIITFMLFGRMNRNISNRKHIQPDIINVNQKKCYGSIYFSINNDIYLISKNCSRSKDDNVKMTTTFYKLTPNEIGQHEFLDNKYSLINLTGKDRYETDKNIIELIGTYEDFLFHSLFLQFDNVSFRKMTPRERKDFMYRLFNLEQFTSQYNKVKDSLKTTKSNLEYIKNSISKTNIVELESNLVNLINTRDNYKTKLVNYENKLNTLNIELATLKNSKIILDQTYKHSRQLELDTLTIELSFIDKKINSLTTIPEKSKILENNIKFLNDKNTKINDLQIIINNLYKNLQLTTEIDFNIDEYTLLKNIEFPENLESEISNLQSIAKNYDIYKKIPDDIDNLTIELELNSINNEIDKLLLENSNLSKILENLKLDKTIESRFLEYNTKKNIDISNNENLNNIIKNLENSLSEYISIEFNPECNVCLKNPKVVVYKNIKKTIIETREKLVDIKIDNELENAYCEFTKLNNESIRLSSNINKNTQLLTELYSKRDKYREWLDIKNMVIVKIKLENLLDLRNKKLRLEKLEMLYNIYINNINIIENNNNINNKISEYNKLLDDVNSMIDYDYLKLTNELVEFENLTKNRDKLVYRMNDVNLYMSYHNKYLIDNENNMRLDMEILKINDEITNLECFSIDELFKLENSISEIGYNIEDYNKNLVVVNNLELEYNRYKYLEDIVSVNGFSLYLLKDNLENMSIGISQILKPLIGISIKLDIVDSDLVLYTYREGNSVSHKLDTFGGMETLMYDLSFRLYSVIYSHLPFSNLLILDETFVSFDSQNLMLVEEVLQLLSKHYNYIIMITHIDVLKDFITKKINLENGDYSYIKFD